MVTKPEDPPFDLIGGALCLDFVNTLGRGVTTLTEHLEGYRDLVRWGRQAGVLTAARADELERAARRAPARAEAVLERARELRETIYRVFAAGVHGRSPTSQDLQRVNQALAEALARARIEPAGKGFRWSWSAAADLESVLWPVARSAAELLTSPELERVKECASDACEWLFLDTTKNHRRRWCEMKTCGNRVKVRRHRERRKG